MLDNTHELLCGLLLLCILEHKEHGDAHRDESECPYKYVGVCHVRLELVRVLVPALLSIATVALEFGVVDEIVISGAELEHAHAVQPEGAVGALT